MTEKSTIVDNLVKSIGGSIMKHKSTKGHSTNRYPAQKARKRTKAELIAKAVADLMKSNAKLSKIKLDMAERKKKMASIRAKENWKLVKLPKILNPFKKLLKPSIFSPTLTDEDLEDWAIAHETKYGKEEKEEKIEEKHLESMLEEASKKLTHPPPLEPITPPHSVLPWPPLIIKSSGTGIKIGIPKRRKYRNM